MVYGALVSLQVKELYRRVLGKVGALHLGPRAAGGGEEEEQGYEDLRREVEKERARRRALAAQLGQLLDSQLQMLRAERRSQDEVHRDFGARLRETLRLLEHISGGSVVWNTHHQQYASSSACPFRYLPASLAFSIPPAFHICVLIHFS